MRPTIPMPGNLCPEIGNLKTLREAPRGSSMIEFKTFGKEQHWERRGPQARGEAVANDLHNRDDRTTPSVLWPRNEISVFVRARCCQLAVGTDADPLFKFGGTTALQD